MTTSSEQARPVPAWTSGWRLRRALAFADMSMEDMADELGVHRQTVGAWINDRSPIKRIYLKAWASRLTKLRHRSSFRHMEQPPLLTTSEAADLLGCSPRTVQRMVDRGTLIAAQKLSGRRGAYLFTRADVDAYLAGQSQGTAA